MTISHLIGSVRHLVSVNLKTLARWEADNSGCGNVVYHQSEGFIRSPGRPGNYQNNQNCKWTIYTEESSHVELTFTAFDLEGGSCIFDYVEIYDGDSEDYPGRPSIHIKINSAI